MLGMNPCQRMLFIPGRRPLARLLSHGRLSCLASPFLQLMIRAGAILSVLVPGNTWQLPKCMRKP